MKAGDVIKAYAAIGPLMEKEMTWQESHDVIDLKRKLQAEAEIFSMQEMKLVNEVADKKDGKIVIDENGRFKVTGPDKVEKYQAERKALTEVEVKWDVPKIKLHVEKIRPAIYEALEKFIEFN